MVILGQGTPSPDNVIGDSAKREDTKGNAKDFDDETFFEGMRRVMGSWRGVAVAGVAAYLTVVYLFWDVFRSYFAWSEALAITIVVNTFLLSFRLFPLPHPLTFL